jgi:hypothetical protein
VRCGDPAGIDSISVNPHAFLATRTRVAELERSTARASGD